jgi:NAD(P)-dependent dehydrogenase (short-subunit alcohol dehydrogenase family)
MKKETTTSMGKAVFITGCSSGIGRATALHLAHNGYTVFASVRKEADARRLSEENESNLIPICPLDLTRLEHIASAAAQVQTELRLRNQDGLFALVNNAGGGSVAPLELLDPDLFRTELQTRLVGAAALVQACLPLLRQGKGRILWIMTPATIPTPYVSSIHACDFAANCLARTLEIELKPWNIPNVQIRCGGIQTATGLQTTAQVESILRLPLAGLYRERLSQWSKEMAEFDQQRLPAEKVAQTVLRALAAPQPRRRYSIGHMAGLAGLLEALPQPLCDAILKMRF